MTWSGKAMRRMLGAAVCWAGLGSAALGDTAVPFPPGAVVDEPIQRPDGEYAPAITTGTAANAYVGATLGGFVGDEPASVVRTTAPSQFVRFYAHGATGDMGSPIGEWAAAPSTVRGLTPAEVKNVLGLPVLPTGLAVIRVPPGSCVLGGEGAPGPWGRAGIPQYFILGRALGPGCTRLVPLASDDFVVEFDMGARALAYAPDAGEGDARAIAEALDAAPAPAPFSALASLYDALDVVAITAPADLPAALVRIAGELCADGRATTLGVPCR